MPGKIGVGLQGVGRGLSLIEQSKTSCRAATLSWPSPESSIRAVDADEVPPVHVPSFTIEIAPSAAESKRRQRGAD